MLIVAALLLGGSYACNSQSPGKGDAARPWQSSWSAFFKDLVSVDGLSENSDDPSVKSKGFEGKEVIWEGTLEIIPAEPSKSLRFRMEPNSAKLFGYSTTMVQFHVKPKPEVFERWKQIPLGTKVRIRATLGSPLYVVVSDWSPPRPLSEAHALLLLQGRNAEPAQ